MVAVKHDLLERPMQQMRRALATDACGHESAWVHQVSRSLADLVKALRAHVCAAEAPNGALATLSDTHQDTVATLDRRVRRLRNEHVQLMDSTSELALYVEGLRNRCMANVLDGIESKEIPLIQELAEEILDRLHQHEECEQKLFVSVVAMDAPGGGD